MRRLAASLIVAMALAALPAAGQSLEAVESAEAALETAWEQAPLGFRNIRFVTEATTYGIYTPRPDARFAPGEPLLVYAEPVGYGFKDNGDGTYSFGVEIDLSVKDASGAEVAAQERFASAILVSRARNREFIVALTLRLNGAPAGDYVVEYLAHDIASNETAPLSLAFTITE